MANLKKIRLKGDKKNTHVTTLKIKTLEYSAMKIKANNPPPNSTLNPETNSASPSGKSKGARLVSAKMEIIHGMKIGNKTNRIAVLFCRNLLKENVWTKEANEIIIKIILTSYEIIWANLRILPNKAYFELEVHPARITK